MDRAYPPCTCCGKFHIHEDCPVFWKEKMMSGYKPPSYQGYYQSNVNYNYVSNWDYDNYESEMTPSSSYYEEYNNYYQEYPQPINQDRYMCNQVCQYQCVDQDSSLSQWDEVMAERKSWNDASTQRLENILRGLAENEEKISRLRRESNIETQEEASRVKELFQESVLSDCVEEVVENNATPISSIDGESKITPVVVHLELNKEVTSLPKQHIEDITPFQSSLIDEIQVYPNPPLGLITLTNKVGDGGLKSKIRMEKDSELGEPLIPIQIGDFKTDNALLDYGARVSVLPGHVYDMYELGPLQQVNASMVLADYSRKRPRGILKGLTVKVGDFYYPEDFVVLDFEPSMEEEQTRVILGRPFLVTSDAHISCRNGTVDMTYGSRKCTLNIFSHSFDYSFENTCSWSVVTNECHSPICEDGPKESVAVIDRSKDEKVVKDKVVKSPWWYKMRNSKSSTKPKNESPKDAIKSKKRPLEVKTGEVSQPKDSTKSMKKSQKTHLTKTKKKPPEESEDESVFFLDYDDPDVMDAIWNDRLQWDDQNRPYLEEVVYDFPYKPP